MSDLLSCFPNLRKFYYDHGGATVGMADFLPQTLGDGLAHLHDCLEELTILGIQQSENYGDKPRRPLGSLAVFKKLRCIGMEAEVLLGPDSVKPQLADILPASLENLLIRICADDIYAQPRDLISRGKRRFPVLKNIAIDIPKSNTGVWYGIGPDGKHEREEQVKKSLEVLALHPEIPDVKKHIRSYTKELELIQSNKPTEADWEEWRRRKEVEQELVAEYEEAGIDLHFGLLRRNTWVFMPSFMFY